MTEAVAASARRLSAHTKLLWALIGALVIAVAVCLPLSGMTMTADTALVTFVAVAALLGVSHVYTRLRPDRRIAALAQMAAVTLAFTAAAACLSYISVTWRLPLIDAGLVAFDRALGIDWPALYESVHSRPPLHIALIIAYFFSPLAPMIVMLVALNFVGRIRRAWEMQWMYVVACLVCLVLSALLPAAGAFHYYQIQPNEPYVKAFLALRDGSLTVIDQNALQGVMQFPSLHAAWAVIYAYAARGMRYFFPVVAVMSALVILATPAVGGHHIADVLAGILVAVATIFAVRKISARGLLPADL
ncbi:MAG TPA: phosphatase PAP2 family protein [Patescibacteria group bacterium]|nr:phosphatase PAP2 family protein [Patescibacteria group bacterium]